jgi:hypothetical protein
VQSLERRTRDTQSPRGFAFGQTDDLSESLRSDTTTRTTETHTLCSRPRQPGFDALLNPSPLELGECREDMKLELARGRRAVNTLTHRDERHTQRLEFVEQRDEMTEIPSEAIEAPAHDHIELPSLRCGNQLVERRATVLRTTHTTIDELRSRSNLALRRNVGVLGVDSLALDRAC